MLHSARTVLIVDDSAAIRRELSEEFMRSGFAFSEAENGSEAIERVRALPPDLIILDLSMPVMNGLEAAPRLREILPQVPIILYTAFADAVTVTDSHASGVTTVFPKSNPLTTLIAAAKKLLDHG